MNEIRFLVVWLGTKCSLKCKNCSNLIPYIKKEEYDIEKIILNIEYFTDNIIIRNMQIQGGEPFIYQNLHKVIEFCAEDKNIDHITIASNATIFPSLKCIEVLSRYSAKVDVRFSIYECVDNKKRSDMIKALKLYGVNVNTYNFLFGTGEWFDSGDINTEFNNNKEEVFKIYKSCRNHNCWTLVNDYLVNCSKIYSLLEIKKESNLEENNIINITNSRLNNINVKTLLDEFDYNYIHQAPYMCGYCQYTNTRIKPAIQLKDKQ